MADNQEFILTGSPVRETSDPGSTSDLDSASGLARWLRRLFPIALFFVAFLPRAIHFVGSTTLWHSRAGTFFDAFLAGQWTETYQAPHPGVITMWLSGLARWVAMFFYPDYDGMALVKRLSIELIPIVLVISLGIVLAFFILRSIFDFQVAAFASLLLALDPYHISLSKTIHVDTLVSTFMLLSALFLWQFIKQSRWPWVLLSGVFAGLGLLSKTPALFMVPYFFLCMLVWQAGLWRGSRSAADGAANAYSWSAGLRAIAGSTVIWLLALAITYFLLWPSMWVRPLETLALTYGGTDFYRDTPHENPVLLLGQVTSTDPGPLFYPVNLAVKTTAVSLLGFLLSFFVLLRGRLQNYQRQAILLGLAFIFFFILMMTLGEKKLDRYMLPALQFVTILAGIGWVYTLRRLWHGRDKMLQLSLALLIGIQLLIIITRFPYFGTHYNYLLGGPRRILENDVVAGQEIGIGVRPAAEYLNQLPLPTELVVGAQNWVTFYHYFEGKTVPLTDDKVDYVLFTRNWTLRGAFANEWGAVWEEYRDRDPKFIVSFDGVPYIWIYKVGPVIEDQDIAHPLDVIIGQDIRLLGYDYAPQEARPGETVLLTLYWEAINSPAEDYTVFSHLLDPQGQLRGQRDNPPQNGRYPTHFWDQGERVQDQYEITLDPDAPPGDYQFALGMYLLETLERLPAYANATGPGTGEELPERSVVIPGPRVLPAGDSP